MEKGFIIDEATRRIVTRVTECVLTPGEINLGWKDISEVLLSDRTAVVTSGSGTGKDRAVKACQDALSSYRIVARPAMRPARVLFHLIGPKDLLLKDVNDAREVIERSLCPASEVVFGVALDDSLKDEVRITIMAT